MAIFGVFRRLLTVLEQIVEALRAIVTALSQISRLQEELGPARGRLEALELSRAHFEAEMGALVLKADGKLKAAANAEARERQLKKSYERLVDPLDEGGDSPETPPRDDGGDYDAEAVEAERLQALRLVVAPNNKAHAQRAKWGAA